MNTVRDKMNAIQTIVSPPYPCESEVKQTNSRAAEEGKQSGVQQLDNETKNSIADEDNDRGCVLHDLLKDYTSDSAEPPDDGNLGEPERVLLALETATPKAISAPMVATHNCGVGMSLNQDMLVDIMRPGGPLQSCGKIKLGDRLVRVDDICCANLKMQAIKDLVLWKVRLKVSLHFTRESVVVTVHLHCEAALAPHLNISGSPLHPPASEACSAHSSNQDPNAGVLAHCDNIHNCDCANVYPQHDCFAASDHPQLCSIGMSLRRKLCHNNPTQRPSWKVSSISARGPLATSGKVRVGGRLVRVNCLDCEDWNLQCIKDEVLGKEGSEVSLVFGQVRGLRGWNYFARLK